MTGRPGSARVAAFKAAVRRGLLLTLILALLGVAAGGFVGQRMATVHSATMTILVSPLNGNPFSTEGSGDDLINLETEAQLVSSTDVAERVQQREGLGTPLSSLLAGLKVDVPPNTQILKITYSSDSSQRSSQLAQHFGQEFLDYRQTRAEDLTRRQQTQLDEQLEARTDEQTELARKLSSANPRSTEARVLQAQLEAITTQINQLRARSSELNAASTYPGQVVTNAAVDDPGLFGSWIVFALAGLAGGVLVGVAIAGLRSRSDSRVHHVDDLTTAGHSLLGKITLTDAEQSRASFASADFRLPNSLRDVRVALLTADRNRPTVIAVATTAHSDAAPVSIGGLALATSGSELTTCVVEGVDAQLPVDRGSADLGSALADRSTLEPAIVQVHDHLRVLPSGDRSDIDDLFLSPHMQGLITHLKRTSDVVLLVGRNVHDASTRALIDLADSVVLEVVEGASSYQHLYRAGDDDRGLKDKLLGVVYVGQTRRGRQPRRAQQDPRNTTGLPAAKNGAPTAEESSAPMRAADPGEFVTDTESEADPDARRHARPTVHVH